MTKGVDETGLCLYAISTMKLNLLSVNADAKTRKGTKFGVMTGILYLAPARESGIVNMCPAASKGCTFNCLYTSGRGAMSNVKRARIAKTILFKREQEKFMGDIASNVLALCKKATKATLQPAIRLNGTSDVAWEKVQVQEGKSIMEINAAVQFYDYSKRVDRMEAYLTGKLPANYHLTFSRSEDNDTDVDKVLKMGGNVAVVFSGKSLPSTYKGYTVIDADLHDARFLDPKNVICGLRAKGKAKNDTSGFVVKV